MNKVELNQEENNQFKLVYLKIVIFTHFFYLKNNGFIAFVCKIKRFRKYCALTQSIKIYAFSLLILVNHPHYYRIEIDTQLLLKFNGIQ